MRALLAARRVLSRMRSGPWPVTAPESAWAEAERRGWIRRAPALPASDIPEGWMICAPGYAELDRMEERERAEIAR